MTTPDEIPDGPVQTQEGDLVDGGPTQAGPTRAEPSQEAVEAAQTTSARDEQPE